MLILQSYAGFRLFELLAVNGLTTDRITFVNHLRGILPFVFRIPVNQVVVIITMRILPNHIQLDFLTVPHLVREKQVQCWRVAFSVGLLVHIQTSGYAVLRFVDGARAVPMIVVDVITQGGHKHGAVVGLVGVFARDVVRDVIEGETQLL